MTKRYAVVGAGMQGTAAAYDLARFGDASAITLLDASLERAQAAAMRVNQLAGRDVADAGVGFADGQLNGHDVVLSCVPYKLHVAVEEAALAASVSVIDLGNDTDVAQEMLARSDEFAAKGISFVPDTGLAPGFVNSIGVWFTEQLDQVDSVRLFCGGLPQNPKPPFNYSLRFSIEGLVGEYVDEAIAIRDHEVVRLETMTELEEVEVPVLGKLEAFTTSSGTSTAPYTFRDTIRSYEYKTLRYPGHIQLMRAFREAGFWSEEPVIVDGQEVIPLHLFYRVMGEKLLDPTDPDLVVVHAIGQGTHAGKPTRIQVDILDRQDPTTGFASMERLTGFSCSIIAIEVAHGRVAKGAIPYEKAVSGDVFLQEIRRRGIDVNIIRQ